MFTYERILTQLNEMRDETYRIFNERIVNIPSGTSIGVRVPILRSLAKKFLKNKEFSMEDLLSFPNEVYEIRLLKCLYCGYIQTDFETRVLWIRSCVSVMRSWAECDLCCAGLKMIRTERERYFSEVENFLAEGDEFSQRFACVILLTQYMDHDWLPQIFSVLNRVNPNQYYTMMGAAWLLAEILLKFYDDGVDYLQNSSVSFEIKRKAVQKACESYRMGDFEKNYLKNLKKQWKR